MCTSTYKIALDIFHIPPKADAFVGLFNSFTMRENMKTLKYPEVQLHRKSFGLSLLFLQV